MKYYFYLYEVRNTINGKVYVGVHKTRNLDDGYMGSGKVIKHAVEKHGIENFTKTILERFTSAEAMYAREKEVVTEEFLNRDDTYNLRRGGNGGFDYINNNGLAFRMEKGSELAIRLNQNRARVVHDKMKTDLTIREKWLESSSLGGKVTTSRHGSNFSKLNGTEKFETARIAAIRKNPQVGIKNSQFGTRWITDGLVDMKIKGDLPEGWSWGRKKKDR